MDKHNIISEAVQNYLKAIYQLDHGEEGPSAQEIAAHVGVSASGVSKMLRHLQKLHLIHYVPYREVHLTPSGQKVALEVIRHHRLLELYLMRSLGYSWEEVHEEAERLEHCISEKFEERIERLLGFPKLDPHGDPIPTRDGRAPEPARETLEAQPSGARLVVRRVTDEDQALLRYLDERGLHPGTKLRLLGQEPFGGSLRVRIGEREERISPDAARHVFVEVIAREPSAEGK